MKFVLVCILLSLSAGALANDENSRARSEQNVETLVKKAKKERKKKVEMCHECGKPEEQCDCQGEGHRKSE